MRKLKKLGGYAVLVGIVLIGGSWGFLVHKTINQVAVYQLPKGMQRFFYRHMDYLVYNAPRPDIRRNTDSTEDTKHFIDLEAYGDSAAYKMPLKWQEAVGLFTKDTLLKYGYVPYHIVAMKEKLTNAFRQQNRDSILFYAADIGHYIGDAHVPLHTTINYDGQLTNQRGLHSLWESFIPELEINNYRLTDKHKARYLPNPAAAIMQAIQHANTLLPDMLLQEKEVTRNFTDSPKYRIQMRRGRESRSYTTAFAKAYASALKNTINDQLLEAAALTADFWYTSWADAGKPDLDKLLVPSFSRANKEILQAEKGSYKRNELIKDNLLQARKKIVDSTSSN